MDVSDDEAVEATFRWVDETLGGVHVLVNAAGATSSHGLLGTGRNRIHLIKQFKLKLNSCTTSKKLVQIRKKDNICRRLENIIILLVREFILRRETVLQAFHSSVSVFSLIYKVQY